MGIELVKQRLESFGYECVEADNWVLQFIIDKVEAHIKHYCNISEIPECLNSVWCDMVCGEFLKSKKATGNLTSIQVEQIVSKIKDGDTEVQYATGTDSDSYLNSFIEKLTTGYETDLIRHRKLCW